MKCRPSGRKYGQRCVVWTFESIRVTARGDPPRTDTAEIGARMSGAKTISPDCDQLAPRAFGASQRVVTGPPEASMRRSFPSEKNPTDFPSGDQKGARAPSVP